LVEEKRFRRTSSSGFSCVIFTVLDPLVFLYAKVPNPVTDVDGLDWEEHIWRAPPTLDAKHLWL
jgi:hypothetical protein